MALSSGFMVYIRNTPVTLGRISSTDKERTTSVGVRQCSFFVPSLSDKYASCLVMFVIKCVRNSFCPVLCPECVRYSSNGVVRCSARPSVTGPYDMQTVFIWVRYGKYNTSSMDKVWAFRRIPYSLNECCIFTYHTKNEQRLYFLTQSSHTSCAWHTYKATTIHCAQSTARVRYRLIGLPIYRYVSWWKPQNRVWENTHNMTSQ